MGKLAKISKVNKRGKLEIRNFIEMTLSNDIVKISTKRT